MQQQQGYKPNNTVRIVTAASLFDGHDAAINIMRRIIQQSGAEVIHLGHNRSVKEVVDCAVQEDAQAIAMTSYQGGHVEYFKYMYDLLNEQGAGHIKIFGGGGGTILPTEIEELHAYGIARIYSPDDGREMGLQGMINDLMQQSDYIPPVTHAATLTDDVKNANPLAIAQAISQIERGEVDGSYWHTLVEESNTTSCVLGITGTGGAGKSSLTDELVRRFLTDFEDKRIAVISVDPSKRKTGGALLGDRIRMNAVHNPRVYMRSFATREANVALNKNVRAALDVLRYAQFDLIIVETAGIGQSDSQITEVADASLYVMTPEYGAATQLEKIDMIDYADIIALNKFDKRGAQDALKDVRKQYQRSRLLWDKDPNTMPVFGTIASQFNDPGTNTFYRSIIDLLNERKQLGWSSSYTITTEMSKKIYIIPPDRTRYLSEIVEENKRYDKLSDQQATVARKLYQLKGAIEQLSDL
ncbi:MAG: cobalamin-dependent protein [Bacteriodetes bacterium]|nr:cobalamin-dependent protein [Bacteroidota bacterium]